MNLKMQSKKTCVVGLGYIGLPTAAIIASQGKLVVGLDINQDIVNIVNQGKIHIIEPGLEDAVNKAVQNGCLKATSSPEAADVFIIAVPTPLKGEDHKPDTSFIEHAIDSIGPVLKKGDLIILESTSPVGTTEMLQAQLAKNRSDLNFFSDKSNKADILIAYCPERVLPGNILYELIENDRVIGGLCKHSSDLAASFYKEFVQGDCLITNARTAEMAKLVENSYRDVNIAFANELALLSKDLKINVWELISLANRHPRVNILNPGAGVGGHCLAVDPWFIIDKSPDLALLIKQARLVNDHTPINIAEDIGNHLLAMKNTTSVEHIHIGILGLTYKPDIDDLRESPAMIIAQILHKKFPNQVFVVEPNITSIDQSLYGDLSLINLSEAMNTCSLLAVLVPHSGFKNLPHLSESNQQILDYCGLTNS